MRFTLGLGTRATNLEIKSNGSNMTWVVPLRQGVFNSYRTLPLLAGAQEKTALLYFDDAWQVPRGSTATTHILKPQIGLRGNIDLSQSVENEYLCMTLTAELGLPTAEVSIEDFENQRPFVIQFLVE